MDERRQVLIQLLRDSNEEVRKSAAQALERLEGLDNLAVLIEKYRDGDKAMKMKVIYAMAKLRAEDSFLILIHALSSPEEDVRAAAVRVLGEIGEIKTIQAIINMLNDSSVTIQTLAVEALGNFRQTEIKLAPRLLPILEHENKYLVMAVINALGKLNAGDSMQSIIKLTKHQDPDIRRAAAEVLGKLTGVAL